MPGMSDLRRGLPQGKFNAKLSWLVAVLAFALVLWLNEAVPFHITSLLAMVLLAVTRVEPFVEVVRLDFGSHIAVFMIGVLTLSALVTVPGLGKRITVFLPSCTGTGTRTILFGSFSSEQCYPCG
jgi:solute carrier family 13 (sodium-dependent dicarboxylate transporter), member 2/3/5